ncbi:tail fiber assembly protein [Pseudomonas tritici]|uniref:tail fiber assembly protein n=1 Tax=Pseudomonas tritici TaxID=2745518 RepID=UPI00387AA238
MSNINNEDMALTAVPMFLFDDANGVYLGAFSKPFPEGFPPPGAVEVSEPHDVLPNPDQVLSTAIAKIDELLALAAIRIAPLQDAIDLETETAADVARLTAWKQYRVAVNRVREKSGFPTSVIWPEPPEGAA